MSMGLDFLPSRPWSLLQRTNRLVLLWLGICERIPRNIL
jgi:hypothetical protein